MSMALEEIDPWTVLFSVWMMRWNVVIGGQADSLTFSGVMHYNMPIVPHDLESFKEGLGGALLVGALPFALFWLLSTVFPVMDNGASEDTEVQAARGQADGRGFDVGQDGKASVVGGS